MEPVLIVKQLFNDLMGDINTFEFSTTVKTSYEDSRRNATSKEAFKRKILEDTIFYIYMNVFYYDLVRAIVEYSLFPEIKKLGDSIVARQHEFLSKVNMEAEVQIYKQHFPHHKVQDEVMQERYSRQLLETELCVYFLVRFCDPNNRRKTLMFLMLEPLVARKAVEERMQDYVNEGLRRVGP